MCLVSHKMLSAEQGVDPTVVELGLKEAGSEAKASSIDYRVKRSFETTHKAQNPLMMSSSLTPPSFVSLMNSLMRNTHGSDLVS